MTETVVGGGCGTMETLLPSPAVCIAERSAEDSVLLARRAESRESSADTSGRAMPVMEIGTYLQRSDSQRQSSQVARRPTDVTTSEERGF